MQQIPPDIMALAYLRYEIVRQLSPMEFYDIWKLNMEGKHFDDIIDEYLIKP